jgi:hypothetical protein
MDANFFVFSEAVFYAFDLKDCKRQKVLHLRMFARFLVVSINAEDLEIGHTIKILKFEIFYTKLKKALRTVEKKDENHLF